MALDEETRREIQHGKADSDQRWAAMRQLFNTMSPERHDSMQRLILDCRDPKRFKHLTPLESTVIYRLMVNCWDQLCVAWAEDYEESKGT